MNISFAMMTAPRPRPTLDKSLASFRMAGFTEHLTIVADEEVSLLGNDHAVTVIVNYPRKGNLKNWVFALETAMADGGDLLAVLQDDITWSLNSRAVLYQELGAMGEMAYSAGYLSLYVDRRHVHEFQSPNKPRWRNWYQSSLGSGALCYILPRLTAAKLIVDKRFLACCVRTDRHDDKIVSQCLLEMGYTLWFRMPGLVNHSLGAGNSAIDKTKVPRDTDAWNKIAS